MSTGGIVAITLGALLAVVVVLGGVAALVSGDDEKKPLVAKSAEASATPSKKSKSKPKPTSTALSREEREALFVATVQQRPALRDADAAALVKLGRAMCKALDDGHSLTSIASSGAADGEFSLKDSGYVTGAAIVGLCPRHKGKIPN
jgi:hypothetical protein